MSEWSSRLAAVSVFGRTWANSRSGLWRKAAVDGSLRSVLHFCAPRFGPLHPVEMENPYGQALKDQSRSNAVHRAAQHRRQSCPVDRAATSLSEELVAGPLVPLPFGGAVMHRFHPHAHRSSCCCERAICDCYDAYWRCPRCEIYWSLVELLVALVLLLIFVVAVAQLRG
jgi:hypothetical protein